MSADPAARRSDYARYLPALLTDARPSSDSLSVNGLLLVMEKILSGFDDEGQAEALGDRGLPVHRRGGLAHTHDGVEAVIDRLHHLLDPYRTPSRFLPWLAGWVGVEPPASWDEHQQRRAVAEQVTALGRRGLLEGLRRYLELHTVAATRPRVAFDDGSRVLFATPTPGSVARLHTLVAHGPFLRDRTTAAYSGLVQPRCIAATPDGHLLIGDAGLRGDSRPVGSGLWRITRAGGYVDTEGAPPRPRALGRRVVDPSGAALEAVEPIAIVIDDRLGPWQAYVLASNGLYRLRPSDLDELVRVATREELQLDEPEDMALDRDGRLLVVGGHGIAEIDVATFRPRTAQPRPLAPGIEPRSIVVTGDQVIIGDARAQTSTGASVDPGPAQLLLLDRRDPAVWVPVPLSDGLGDEPNPLVAPVAIASAGPETLLVLDAGLRPLKGGASRPFHRIRIESAAVYRVELRLSAGATHPGVVRIERLTETGRLVWPTGMAVVDGTVYISEPGDPTETDESPRFRDATHDLAVVMHFIRQTDPQSRQRQRVQAHDVASLVDRHKPASTAVRAPHLPN